VISFLIWLERLALCVLPTFRHILLQFLIAQYYFKTKVPDTILSIFFLQLQRMPRAQLFARHYEKAFIKCLLSEYTRPSITSVAISWINFYIAVWRRDVEASAVIIAARGIRWCADHKRKPRKFRGTKIFSYWSSVMCIWCSHWCEFFLYSNQDSISSMNFWKSLLKLMEIIIAECFVRLNGIPIDAQIFSGFCESFFHF